MIELLEKRQPIPKSYLEGIQEFLEKLADKDVQAFGICYVNREGDVQEIHFESDHQYKLPAAADGGL